MKWRNERKGPRPWWAVAAALEAHIKLKSLYLAVGGSEAQWEKTRQALIEEAKTAPRADYP